MSDLTKWKSLTPMLVVGGLFTVVLLVIDLTYSNLAGMFKGEAAWLGAVWVILHLAIAVGWFIVISHWNDPAKNLFRVILIMMILLTIGLTLGHRAGWLEDQQIIIDSKTNQ